MPEFIFSAGSARGGTGLLTRMLSVSPKVEIALDPYLGLFKSWRTAIMRQDAPPSVKAGYNPSAPVQDYYFSAQGIQELDLILSASLDIPFDPSEWDALLNFLKARAVLSSGDLVDSMHTLEGKTYRELFENGQKLIQTSRRKDLQWVGIHENWTVEFLLPLANAFPKAKFFILLRDPRAVIASSLKVANEAERGQVLSYARSLRKMMACAYHFKKMDVFNGRLMVVRYEDLVINAEEECRKLCLFLGIPYAQEMLDTDRYVEPATGAVYNGFSSYEQAAAGISTERIYRWRSHLSDEVTALIDFICAAEMGLFGYECGKADGRVLPVAHLRETLREDVTRKAAWRTDLGDAHKDFELELARQQFIDAGGKGGGIVEIRQQFLFTDVKDAIMTAKAGQV